MIDRYSAVRRFSEELCENLSTEDYVVQTMPDVSPTKWHLAHTTWFFETFVLREHLPGYEPVHSAFEYLFNSYYQAVGEQFDRPSRGLLTRPTVTEVYDYRARVDEAMAKLLRDRNPEVERLVEIGTHHEQQHQELILTDIKHVFAFNPLRPVFSDRAARPSTGGAEPLRWHRYDEGVRTIGFDREGFAHDNESPRHTRLVHAFEIASRPVTAGQWLEFIDDGGYERTNLWLSAGWAQREQEGWKAPLYWEQRDGKWWEMTLGGMRELDRDAPVTHVSFYEAEAFARWAGARLPDEFEWEVASADHDVRLGNFVETLRLHPAAAVHGQFFGDVWEWTRSDYAPYPRYQPAEGALGEYNGKFMSGQYVLRGGSCATSASHIRPTYRNFFPPHARWQFSGVRLARDCE